MPYYAGDFYRGDVHPSGGVLRDLFRKTPKTGIEWVDKPAEAWAGREPARGAGGGSPAEWMARGTSAHEEGRAGLHRYRRMNPLNPRALRRSMRRVQSFARFASKTMTFVKRHKMKKHRR